MSESYGERRAQRLRNRVSARLSGFGPRANAFRSQPEPRTIGSLARGRQLVAGEFLFAGYLVEAPEVGLWDLPMPDGVFERELHGFSWLDDLAALGTPEARQRAQRWTHDWVRRYGGGAGPGWTPDLAGKRVMRLINHAVLLLNGQEAETSRAFFRALSRQVVFLARRQRSARPGLPRFEVLCALVHAGLSLQGMERRLQPALRSLARECAERIDAEGGIASRSPEDLLEIFMLLAFTLEALGAAEIIAPEALSKAVGRIAPTLRTLRHADGGLARFHGGGRGVPGRLDQALAVAGVRQMRHTGLAMGYARLSQGRTSVIVDAAPPPGGEGALNAHASTLAFELTSGRRPLVVNCGSGVSFGTSWRRAGRATPSHSTLAIEGYSSSRLGAAGLFGGRRTELLHDTPRDVTCTRPEGGRVLILSHDGYLGTHGLIHHRRLEIGADGRSLVGDDSLAALTAEAERTFDEAFDRTGVSGVPFHIRFHLHPDVEAETNPEGDNVRMTLRSGEVWTFRSDGDAGLTLAPSVYLERGRLAPRATRQIVLSALAADYATRIGWTLAKAEDTPAHIRDVSFEEDDLVAADR